MNPYERPPLSPYEQKLRDEVIYLHSLWHQGPPTQNHNPHRYAPPSSYVSYPSRNLHVSNPTPFKKTNRNKPRNQNAKKNHNVPSGSGSDPQPYPGPEWPCNPLPASPPQSGSGWPEFKANLSPSTRPVNEPDEGKIASMQMQQKVVKFCKEFFIKSVGCDDNEDIELDEEGGGEEDDFDEVEVSEEGEEFQFFMSLFVENQELRDYYEKSADSGDFYCLVCGGIGVKVWKLFKGCAGLVQHAIAISRTKRKRAHRAFGQVICNVLGWDISRLPTIVLKGEPLSRSLANSHQTKNFEDEGDGKKVDEELSNEMPTMEANKEEATECLVEPKKNADCGNEVSNFPKDIAGNDNVLASREDSNIPKKNGVQISCESALNGGTVGTHVNDLNKEHIKANKLGVEDFKTNLKEDGANYKKKNIEFWVKNCCWPEARWSQSMMKPISIEKGTKSQGYGTNCLTEDHVTNSTATEKMEETK